jgi:trimethylamine:corrinoid methyltransferase-like protein
MLAMELTRTEGPRGNYLANVHTANYCRRELWESRYFGANYPISSGGLPDEDLVERIDGELQEILLSHQPVALAPEILRELRSIADRFRESETGTPTT